MAATATLNGVGIQASRGAGCRAGSGLRERVGSGGTDRAREVLAELVERVEQAEQDLRYAHSRWMYWENRARRAVKVKS